MASQKDQRNPEISSEKHKNAPRGETKTKPVLFIFCGLLLLTGCRGPRGQKGDRGPAGPIGLSGLPAEFSEFSGTATKKAFIINVGFLDSDSIVSCYYALANFPTLFLELGSPYDPSGEPWVIVDYKYGSVTYFNMNVGDKYKIIVAKKPAQSMKFGSKLLL